MAPGTYTIQKYGFQQIEPVTVTMTVDEDRILSVELDGNKDSVAMVRSVKNLLIPRIIANQSYAVDAITGATSTSNAVLTGVRDMLADALVAGGSDESALAAFESREAKSDISETVDVDVLVVGLGASARRRFWLRRKHSRTRVSRSACWASTRRGVGAARVPSPAPSWA